MPPNEEERRKRRKYVTEQGLNSAQSLIRTVGDHRLVKTENHRPPGELAAPYRDPFRRTMGETFAATHFQPTGALKTIKGEAKEFAQRHLRPYWMPALGPQGGEVLPRYARGQEGGYMQPAYRRETPVSPTTISDEESPMTYGKPAMTDTARRAAAAVGAQPASGKTAGAKRRQMADWRNLPENERPIEVLRGNTMTFWDPKTGDEYLTAREAVAGKGRTVKAGQIFGEKEAEAERKRAHAIRLQQMQEAGLWKRAERMAQAQEKVGLKPKIFPKEFTEGFGLGEGAVGPGSYDPATGVWTPIRTATTMQGELAAAGTDASALLRILNSYGDNWESAYATLNKDQKKAVKKALSE